VNNFLFCLYCSNNINVPPDKIFQDSNIFYILYWVLHSLSRYDGLETEQKPLHYVFVDLVDVNLCTVTVIELIVFSWRFNRRVNILNSASPSLNLASSLLDNIANDSRKQTESTLNRLA
jgi:hypothetical protein